MDSVTDKIKNLDQRISDVSDQMDELLQTKINLMMLKREIQYSDISDKLRVSYEQTIKENYNLSRFLDGWNDLFYQTINNYKG